MGFWDRGMGKGEIMFSIKCTRCGEIINAENEHDSEVKFNIHKCKGMRDIHTMPFDLLTAVVKHEMTEEEAWKAFDSSQMIVATL